jgi:hypothetical protein
MSHGLLVAPEGGAAGGGPPVQVAPPEPVEPEPPDPLPLPPEPLLFPPDPLEPPEAAASLPLPVDVTVQALRQNPMAAANVN